MASSPLVSVVIPAFNHSEYVLATLSSVHDQTYPRLELILVDDCSADETFELAETLLGTPFRRRFERVEMVRNRQNHGAHASLNLGIKLSKGDFIAFLNSDDLFHKQRIEKILNHLQASGSEFGFSLVDVLAEGASRQSDTAEAAIRSNPQLGPFVLYGLRQKLAIAREPTIGFSLLRQNVAVSSGNFVVSTRVANALGGFLPLRYCHDWEFVLQAVVLTEPVCVMEPLYSYRLHRRNTFRSLESVRDVEAEVTLRRFFRQVHRLQPPNQLCPSPWTWGATFQCLLTKQGSPMCATPKMAAACRVGAFTTGPSACKHAREPANETWWRP